MKAFRWLYSWVAAALLSTWNLGLAAPQLVLGGGAVSQQALGATEPVTGSAVRNTGQNAEVT